MGWQLGRKWVYPDQDGYLWNWEGCKFMNLLVKLCFFPTTVTFDRDAQLPNVHEMDDRIQLRHHHLLLLPVLSVTYQKCTAASGVSLISTWTSAHTVSSPRRWSALAPKIANVLGLDLPIVAKLCAGLQNVPHFKRKQPIILDTDNLASRRHIFYYIKTIGVIIIWFKSWNKLVNRSYCFLSTREYQPLRLTPSLFCV